VNCIAGAGQFEHRYLERTLRPRAITRPRLSQGRLTVSIVGCRLADRRGHPVMDTISSRVKSSSL